MSTHLLSAARGSSGTVVTFIFTIAMAYACGVIAQRKGRSRFIWFILGGFFSIITLVTVVLIPRRQPTPTREMLDPDRGR